MKDEVSTSTRGEAAADLPGGAILKNTWAVSPDLLCVLGLDGSFIASNPAWQATLGWSAQELRASSFLDLVHPDDGAQTLACWEGVRDNHPALRFENRYRAKSGEWRWLSWVVVLEVDQVYGTGRDIHAQKDQVLALARTVAERDRLWQNSQDLLLVIDRLGQFVSVSPAATMILGWTPDELVGRPLHDFIVEDDLPATVQAFAQALHGPIPAIENRCRHKEGGFRWLSWVAAPEGDLVFATGRHVSAQKEAQQVLARTAAERDRIMRNSRDLIVVVDMSGRLLSVNEAIHHQLGWRCDEMLGRTMMEFIHPDHQPPLGPDGQLIWERYQQPRVILNRFRCRNKGYRWISWSTVTEDGLIYAQGRDVTAEREQAAALQAAEESLRQSQKMEAVGQLTGGIAHDFNNLLAAIIGSLDIARRRIEGARWDEVDCHAHAALGAARRASALTQRLLAFSRRQSLDPQAVDVNRLLANIEDLARRTVGPSIAFQRVAVPDLWTTLVDANQLENAVLNLCINARDAMPTGGRIRLETANEQIDERKAQALGVAPGAYVVIRVADTGTGMSREVVAKAFEPFFTTKPLGMGTGLGLSMVFGFVRQSGGQVRIDSEPGRGTTLHLYLPRHAGVTGACAEPKVAEERRRCSGEGKTVLVIEDEPTVRGLVAEVLADSGYGVLAAEDGLEALQILQLPTRIDLMIADFGLPGALDGRQVADAARVRRPNLKVLFITGYAEDTVTTSAEFDDDDMSILTKPFDVDVLEGKIRKMLEA